MKTRVILAICSILLLGSVAQAKDCNNTCTAYPQAWGTSCPDGERCIAFSNSCSFEVTLSYQVGCDANGNPGAPQCNCTQGPSIEAGGTAYWTITDINDSSDCTPKISPSCLTSGLAVMINQGTAMDCTQGTRVEFTAGNHLDPYGKFDSYNIDVEKQWYSVPTLFKTDVSCSITTTLDCRPLWCNQVDCPDAYSAPTVGKCTARSPQAACQDTFNQSVGFTVELCPSGCATTGSSCPSCQDSKLCS